MLIMWRGWSEKHGYCHLKQSLFDIYAHYPNILSQCWGSFIYKLQGSCIYAHIRFLHNVDFFFERHVWVFQPLGMNISTRPDGGRLK